MTATKRAKPPTRVEIALDYVTQEIADGNLKPGDKLPTEKELAELLGISRTPMREAIKTLAISGLIETKHGLGNYIAQTNAMPAMPLAMFQLYLKESSPEMLMELRYIFDRNCTELAAMRRDEEDLESMQKCIDLLRELSKNPKKNIDAMLKADLDFHRAVYKAAKNPLIATVADFVLDMVAPWVKRSLEVSGHERAVHLHEEMIDAIREGKTEQLMRESVMLNMEHFISSLSPQKAANASESFSTKS